MQVELNETMVNLSSPRLLSAMLILLAAFCSQKSIAAIRAEAVAVPVMGTQLRGEWLLPSDGPKAVAIILPGSGNVGMDGDVSGALMGAGYHGQRTDLSKQIAEVLAASGVASLRYAKRGFDDPKQLVNQSMTYLVSDAKSALEFAKNRFPGVKAVLVGLSEGALVSVRAAAEMPVDALFLLSLPTRTIDELFHYQFVEWPVDLLGRGLDRDPTDGKLSAKELALLGPAGTLPLLPLLWAPQASTWEAIDANHDNVVDIAAELAPAYEKAYDDLLRLMTTPSFSAWYKGLKESEKERTFAEAAAQISVPVVIYQAMSDAQLNWSWADEDKRFFSGRTSFRLFGNGLGHCFSPMDGSIGQIKTAGPIDASVLESLRQDFTALF